MGEIDLWIIDDDKSADLMLEAEHDLIEDYLEGNLSGEQAAKFRSNFMISAERREMMDEVLLLRRLAGRQPAGKPASEPRSGFLSGLFSLPRPLIAAFAVLAIGVFGYLGWRVLQSPGRSPLEVEYAALNQQELLVSDDRYSMIQLASGTLRDIAAAPKLVSASLRESVLFRLALPFDPSPELRFKAELVRGADVVFTIERTHVYRAAAGSEVRLLIPRSRLFKGPHHLRLQSGDADSAILYSFTVE